ncbi:MAG: bifunctional [glutamine synthetase] adenylyltransferase/[glutamine synthetase]-adenylyl-L-tyrosine phosphorylase [Rhodospirillaceae bacterium]|nr:bifunctional [glutamine synthetase] adenylyltransferase/[glutamine synthetase]-adenylyl-L-tyrosine phosphorylase [Rhodospirillaceae bacterium]
MNLKSDRLAYSIDPIMVGYNRNHWLEATINLDNTSLIKFVQSVLEEQQYCHFIDAIFSNSPYLTYCLINETDFFRHILSDEPKLLFSKLLTKLKSDIQKTKETSSIMTLLRIAKRRVALLIGISDLCNIWSLDDITKSLSKFADTTLSLAISHLLYQAHLKGEIILPYPESPEYACGLTILGMGKLGAKELNYSSDIDLIIIYDESLVNYCGRRSIQEFFVRLTRNLIHLLEERTNDGYVFRTDLRLRPDFGSTPLAISLEAAEIYYEGFGQNWERAAMIKVRPVAGDIDVGMNFIKFLKPFIWRRHLDFAAIQDIHSIKRQINTYTGANRITTVGHNIKLGCGGIREIEFFVQTQQLIWGGRESYLQESRTVDALHALSTANHIDKTVAAELIEAYEFLRRLEHRLQMIDDKQTQTLPEKPEKLKSLAGFFGFAKFELFTSELIRILRMVELHYAKLFETAPPLSIGGNLVFTGSENDPETLKTIANLGFNQVSIICSQIRSWHHGRISATRSTQAREILTELTPALLAALARTSNPDSSFHSFNNFLSHLPIGVPLFSMFSANLYLLDLIVEIIADAPRLAELLSTNTSLLDNVLINGLFESLSSKTILIEDANRIFTQIEDYQETLKLARCWVSEQKFHTGLQTLHNLLDSQQAGKHLSNIADATLIALQSRVETEFTLHHGKLPGRGLAIIAMGKMGSCEMTVTSDLDLILVYDSDCELDYSDGAKPLSCSSYYAKFTKWIINALNTKIGHDTLYEVDMRLRPSGNSGPIATSLKAFSKYHANTSWTWEHMALTRARIITGNSSLKNSITNIFHQILRKNRDPLKLLIDVADMRHRIAREHKINHPWDVKYFRGGLVDIEFIAQYLQLRWAINYPSLILTNTDEILIESEKIGLLKTNQAKILQDSLHMWSTIQQILRQAINGFFDEETASEHLKEILAQQTTGSSNFNALRIIMNKQANQVQNLYEQIIEKSIV